MIADALRQSEALFRSLVEQMPEACLVLDGRHRIAHVNQRACDMLGYRRNELLEMRLTEVEADDEELSERSSVAGKPEEAVILERAYRRKDGSTLRVAVRIAPLEPTGADRVFVILRVLAERELLRLRSAASTEGTAALQKRLGRILVAADRETSSLLERSLEAEGQSVLTVSDGQAAVSAVEREHFDLVLMDVELADLDGCEATTRIRQRERYTGERVPVIALTIRMGERDRQRFLSSGMDGWLVKPVDEEELSAMVANWTSERGEGMTSRAVLDMNVLRMRTGDDPELERELAELFLDESPRLLRTLLDALASEDVVAIRKAAHRMKGSLSTLGAVQAAHTASRIEDAARQRDARDAARQAVHFEDELRRLCSELNRIADSAATVA